ncbi:RNA polymerase sigma factor SigM [Ornithinimicrobium avium]|uniref:RNA polymerase sigma factor SigM n=1 Tax=Ornithinimicrobium avium TaxID=2283195 RepID=A0A345NP10_9MICO|nr:RNA polymerase sigma factor SigM [Ornithinimicrobium avium]AXH96768.1 RNA polymerase sigma factor SigM [Ornithinimicrobium avium]
MTRDLTELDDHTLIRLHVEGDADAFGEIFRRHRDRMWALALRTTRDREMAADAVQDAFLNAFRRAASFRGDAQLTTWLHRITVNASLDRLRRVRPTADIEDHEPVEPRDGHHAVDVRLDVRAALAELPEAQRLALTLVDLHGLSVAEAAAVLEVAEGTVKSRCSRGREAMARILRPTQGPGAEV